MGLTKTQDNSCYILVRKDLDMSGITCLKRWHNNIQIWSQRSFLPYKHTLLHLKYFLPYMHMLLHLSRDEIHFSSQWNLGCPGDSSIEWQWKWYCISSGTSPLESWQLPLLFLEAATMIQTDTWTRLLNAQLSPEKRSWEGDRGPEMRGKLQSLLI